MYKIAVQFYGHARSFRRTFAFFKENVLKANSNLQVDVFIHTWDELEHNEPRGHYKKDECIVNKKLSPEDENFLRQNYAVKGLKITPQLSLNKEQKDKILRDDFKIRATPFDVSFSMQSVNELRQNYEKKGFQIFKKYKIAA